MSRLLHFVGGRVIEPTDAERDRIERTRCMRTAAESPTVPAMPVTDPQQLPHDMTGIGPRGPVTVHRMDVLYPLPLLHQLVTEAQGVPVAGVWSVLHADEASGQALRGMAVKTDAGDR